MLKIIKFFLVAFQFISLGVIFVLAFYFLHGKLNFAYDYQSFVVQSGSMEPAIMTGDVIIIQEQEEYLVNDVITFIDNDDRIVTHRIIKITDEGDLPSYHTKGDANRAEDRDLVFYKNVLGKVVFVLPRFGFLVTFSKTTNGLIAMILIPSLILVSDQLLKIINAKEKDN